MPSGETSSTGFCCGQAGSGTQKGSKSLDRSTNSVTRERAQAYDKAIQIRQDPGREVVIHSAFEPKASILWGRVRAVTCSLLSHRNLQQGPLLLRNQHEADEGPLRLLGSGSLQMRQVAVPVLGIFLILSYI